MIVLNLYARIATEAEKNALDWQAAASWQAFANLSDNYYANNSSVQENRQGFDAEVAKLRGQPKQGGGQQPGELGGQQQQLGKVIIKEPRFAIPLAAQAWFDDPHNNKLTLLGKEEPWLGNHPLYPGLQKRFFADQVMLPDGSKVPIAREGNATAGTTLSNFYNDMKLKLPPITNQITLEFTDLEDQNKWIEWHSIEAMMQAFKVFITGYEQNFPWEDWANKQPNDAKANANNILRERRLTYEAYQHRLFRFVCASIAIKFLTNQGLAQELVNIKGWILEGTTWEDKIWGGKNNALSYHKLGWILMNVREMLYQDQRLIDQVHAPRYFARIYNATLLFPGEDELKNGGNQFVINYQNIKSIEQFGFKKTE